MEYPDIEVIETLLDGEEYCGPDRKREPYSRAIHKILLFSAFVGEDFHTLSLASRVDAKAVSEIIAALRTSNVFGCGLNHYEDYFLSTDSGIHLQLDSQCGLGYMTRVAVKPRSWAMTASGIEYAENLAANNPEAKILLDHLVKNMKHPRNSQPN